MPKDFGQEIWDELVDRVRVDDGLPVFESKGMWTAHKLFFVCQYLEQTTRGLKTRRAKFPRGLTYIDLFCGTGISVVRSEDGSSRRFPGSPVIAASIPEGFDRLILIDKDADALNAALTRVAATGYAGEVLGRNVDVNGAASQVAGLVPEDSLNIAFVDPYSLDIHFDTIRQIASRRQLDLIILFSDRFDLGRNVHKYYYPNEEQSKLDSFLGTRDWREELDALGDQSGIRVRELFASFYERQLRAIGYVHTKHWPLEGPMGPAFRLFFASRHELGLKFCDIATRKDFQGNRGLFGGF